MYLYRWWRRGGCFSRGSGAQAQAPRCTTSGRRGGRWRPRRATLRTLVSTWHELSTQLIALPLPSWLGPWWKSGRAALPRARRSPSLCLQSTSSPSLGSCLPPFASCLVRASCARGAAHVCVCVCVDLVLVELGCMRGACTLLMLHVWCSIAQLGRMPQLTCCTYAAANGEGRDG